MFTLDGLYEYGFVQVCWFNLFGFVHGVSSVTPVAELSFYLSGAALALAPWVR